MAVHQDEIAFALRHLATPSERAVLRTRATEARKVADDYGDMEWCVDLMEDFLDRT